MKVVVNAISAQTGGIVTYTNNLIAQALGQGIALTVYVPRDFVSTVKLDPGNGIEIRHLSVSGYGPLRRLLWEQTIWRREIRKSGADVLYSSANYGVLFSPIPQVLMIQGEISFDPLYRSKIFPILGLGERLAAMIRRWLAVASARQSALVILPSHASEANVTMHCHGIKGKTFVSHLGVDKNFMAERDRRSWRADGSLTLFFHSVYYPHKSPETLLQAAMILRGKKFSPKVRLTFEQQDFDNWKHGKTEQNILYDSAYADILETGRIAHDKIATQLDQTDVFVFPSISETFGFPMVEAMASGVPMVVADTRINREICGDTALYFEPENAKELVERILELDASPDLRASFRTRQIERVKERYSWANHFHELMAEMQRLHRNRTGG
jgi:glycosyltransferase involved in cell wall biosynthesis